jgi:hypothetical protein
VTRSITHSHRGAWPAPLCRAGYDEPLISEVARVMEYQAAYELYRNDVEYAA